jgi:hypothetical protein
MQPARRAYQHYGERMVLGWANSFLMTNPRGKKKEGFAPEETSVIPPSRVTSN